MYDEQRKRRKKNTTVQRVNKKKEDQNGLNPVSTFSCAVFKLYLQTTMINKASTSASHLLNSEATEMYN